MGHIDKRLDWVKYCHKALTLPDSPKLNLTKYDLIVSSLITYAHILDCVSRPSGVGDRECSCRGRHNLDRIGARRYIIPYAVIGRSACIARADGYDGGT